MWIKNNLRFQSITICIFIDKYVPIKCDEDRAYRKQIIICKLFNYTYLNVRNVFETFGRFSFFLVEHVFKHSIVFIVH